MSRLSVALLRAASSLLFLFALTAPAQNITSTVLGLVTDSTGAGVADAEITVTNEGTGISFRTSADTSGAYSVPNLQLGTYTVAVSKAGFRTHRSTGVQVLSQQTVRVNAQLQVGEVQQSVEVTGEAPLIKTESPTIGGTVNTQQMANLPLQQQSIDMLMALVPGAQVSGSSPQTGGGTHWGSFNFTLNGVAANDFGNGAGAYSYGMGMISLPAVQSMSEFKVEAYNTSAEFRNLGTISMITKSGSNSFHGDAYEYLQNAKLNANAFTNNALARPKPMAIRNQFGVNIGGPIVKNKAFFFFDYSGMRDRTYNVPQLTYPSPAMRQGDFSALPTQLFNPWTGQPFANNRIPASMITSQSQALVKYLPDPNVSINSAGLPNGGQNYFGNVAFAKNMNAADVRLDWQISEKDQLYGVYTRNVGDPWQVSLGYPSTYGNASNYGYKTFGYSLVETHTFNPRLLNDFRASWFDHPNIRSGMNLDFDPTTLFPQLTKSTNRGLPTMSMTGYTSITDSGRGYYSHAFNWEFADNLTYVRGRHTWKFGASTATFKSYGPNTNAPLGSFAFSGQWTGNKGWPGQTQTPGNAFADFLLGTANSSTTGFAGVFSGVYWSWDTEFYAQDTWQISKNLTGYFGVRYMYQTPWNWQNGYSTYWDPASNRLALPQDSDTAVFPSIGASRAMFDAYNFTTTKALGLPSRYMIGDKNNWGPRVGLAWRPFGDSRTVIRSGYGVYYNFNPTYVGGRDDVLSPPWVGGLGGFSGSNYLSQLTGNITQPFAPDVTFADPFPSKLAAASGASANPTIYAMQRDFKSAAIQQWNLTVERQFTENWAGRATYAGSQSHHLQWFFGDYNVPTKQVPNASLQSQRPFQPWAAIMSTRSGAWQNFNQLQLEATKRFSRGFSFQAQYQWTRSLDNADYSGGPMIPEKPQLDYGNSAAIRRHVLTFNYIYQLPFGRGAQFLSSINRAADLIIGGWQLSGISDYRTGAPTSVGFQVPPSVIGWWGSNNRADVVSNDFYAGQGSGHDIISGIQWFNVNAFAPPQKWQWGNSARNLLFLPGSWNWDVSLAKNIPIHESMRVQVKVDFLNAFNHFNLGGPGTQIANTRDGGPPIVNAGRITSGSGNRIIQVGARFFF